MSPKKEIASKEHSAASLKKLREILANEPEAAKIFRDEQNRRWSLIAQEKREWLCNLAGVPEAGKLRYSEITKADRLKIRTRLQRLQYLLNEFDFVVKQG